MGAIRGDLLGEGVKCGWAPGLRPGVASFCPLPHLSRGTAPQCVGFLFFFLGSNLHVVFHNVEEIQWLPTGLLCARLLALAWKPCRPELGPGVRRESSALDKTPPRLPASAFPSMTGRHWKTELISRLLYPNALI